MELEDIFLVLLPVKEVLAMINAIAALQVIKLSLNLARFLANHIVFKRLMIAAVTVILDCGDQFKSHNFHISSMVVNWMVRFKQPANHDQRILAKSHWKKRWKVVSTCLRHKLHMEGIAQPLVIKFSSVGIFSCINLQTMRDFEGRISELQIYLVQKRSCSCGILKL